jgi:hypothetical protein
MNHKFGSCDDYILLLGTNRSDSSEGNTYKILDRQTNKIAMSHFDNIGFSVNSPEEFSTVMSEIFKLAKIHSPASDRTYLWNDGNAKIWFHPDKNWCTAPTFSTEYSIKIRPIEWAKSSNNCSHCYILYVDILDSENHCLYPTSITFGDVEFAKSFIEIGEICRLRVAAFVESGKYWSSLAEYKSQHPSQSTISTRVFTRGFFPLDRHSAFDSPKENTPRALICGTVQNIKHFKNSHTGISYRLFETENTGSICEFIVSDKILLDLAVGSIVQVECWLCAELIDN